MHSKKSKRLCEAANGSDWMPCLMQELPTDTEPFNLLMIVTGKTDEICGKYSYQLDDNHRRSSDGSMAECLI